ncbi:N-6 DNA methylase [Micromonospora sp. ATA32]|nr:N-6 DNA methylase [Micromonospora sp. ATA32]
MSATARNQVFSAVHTIGGLLPADMLVRISEGKDVTGSKPADYRAVASRSVRDDAERHWDYLKSVWKELRGKLPVAPEADAPADPTGLAVTQWLEPLFAEFGFGRLTSIGASGIPSDDGAKTFPISHRWQHVPIHLAPWNASLDKRPAGAGTIPPQSLVQECLNRSEAHLWGALTNGRQLRLLRDSNALATASYVEFDLEAIFDGELFSEFVLLYRLLHVSRFEVGEGAAPSTCWLEKWRTESISSGVRALEQLRRGVQEAITTLGTGFLRHPDNNRLREDFDVQAFHNALLRLVYRLLFLFVAEDRDALHPPGTSDEARERYAKYFSSARMRAHARRRRGSAHGDLYQALQIVLGALGDVNGRPELGVPGLGGIFDDREADAPLRGLTLSNEYLLNAVRHLCQVRDAASRRWRSIDYRHLDAEELGSIYESLLELVPKHSAVDCTFELVELAGNTRKTTGSYYTPSSLIECLLDSALDPVIDDAVKHGEQVATAAGQPDPSDTIVSELLSLTVCDPACGSGHFLVAAARRIAKRVAAVRERNPEPTLDAVRHAMHEVIARCIYGVDLNPMAVELAKVSLWLEALEPGKPLSFLDAHIKHGNALIGATPALLKRGIPDEAFKPIEGDDKKHAKGLEKQNAQQRARQGSLFDPTEGTKVANTVFAHGLRRITAAPSDDLSEVRWQESAYRDFLGSDEYKRALHIADAWCAAYMWRKTEDAPPAVTHGVFQAMEEPEAAAAPQATHDEIERLRERYRFFHWHLEFPDVFQVAVTAADIDPATGWAGGFDCVFGNPPWERIKLQEQEFFAQRDEAIATAANAAARKKLIAALKDDEERRSLYEEFEAAKRKAEGESHFLRNGGRYPLTGRGDINTYAVFSETDRILMGARGRMGVIVPTGICTDATTQHFFRDVVEASQLVSLFDFDNKESIFPAVGAVVRFCLMTLSSKALAQVATSFLSRNVAEIRDPAKLVHLTPEQILLMNPNTGTLTAFIDARAAGVLSSIYERVKIFSSDNRHNEEWRISYGTMFHMASDSALFRSREMLESEGWTLKGATFVRGRDKMVPLYEPKNLHIYDHRFGTFDGVAPASRFTRKAPTLGINHEDPNVEVIPRYWVSWKEFENKWQTSHDWAISLRDMTNPVTNARTAIFCVVPAAAFGHSAPVLFSDSMDARQHSMLVANFGSFIYDFIVRQKITGGHLTLFLIRQIPVLNPSQLSIHANFLIPRVLELSYTSYAMVAFAADLNDQGNPFRWDEGRRAVIRAELDALFFHLYGISRDDVDYIMETFPIGRRKDEAKYGTYRTKELILAEYDRMAAAGVSLSTPLVDGENYKSTLTPPPGRGPRHPAAPAIPRQRAGESAAQRASQVRPG